MLTENRKKKGYKMTSDLKTMIFFHTDSQKQTQNQGPVRNISKRMNLMLFK